MREVSLSSVAALAGALTVVGTLLMRPAYGLYLLPWLLITWFGVVPLPGVGESAALRASDVAVALLAAATVGRLLVRPRLVLADRFFTGVPLLLVATQLVFGVTGAITSGSGMVLLDVLLFLKNWGMYAILPLAIAAFRDQLRSETLQKSILWSSVIGVAWSVWEFQSGQQRVTGPVGNPNRFGILMAAYSCITLAYLVTPSSKEVGRGTVVLYLLQLLAVVLSASRAAMLGVAVVSGYAFAKTTRSSRRLRMVAVLTAILIVVLVSPLGDTLVRRYGQVLQGDVNLAARVLGFRKGTEMVVAHPFGLGPAWRLDPERIRSSEAAVYVTDSLVQLGPHTLFLNWILDTSWIGLFSLLLLIWTWFRGPRPTATTWGVSQPALALRFIVMAMTIIGLLDQPFMLSQVSGLTWLIAATVELSPVVARQSNSRRYLSIREREHGSPNAEVSRWGHCTVQVRCAEREDGRSGDTCKLSSRGAVAWQGEGRRGAHGVYRELGCIGGPDRSGR